MDSIFVQLAIILGLSSVFGFITKKLNLPILIAYLMVGILISAVSSFKFSGSSFSTLPDLGIAFALFLIGMELDFREIGSLGKAIVISCLTQITISALAGYTLSNLFGIHGFEAIYLGVGLSFSSTIVIVKLLLDRHDLTSLYGKLSIGVTLTEDIIALLVLMFLSGAGGNLSINLGDSLLIASVVVKGLILLLLAYLSAKYFLVGLFKSLSRYSELMFLVALTWCFIFVSISLSIGFSAVIGAFLAGIALASSPFHYAISGKVKPLRDFFSVLFFVYLGSQVSFEAAFSHIYLILAFVAYALVVKPLILSLMFGAFGFRKHTIFQTAINLSQISEFSLIILLLGIRLNLVSPETLSVMALSVPLSIIVSSVTITHSKKIYPRIRKFLEFFERKGKFHNLEFRGDQKLQDHVVIIGGGRVGGPIIEFLKKKSVPMMVLDFNPSVVASLRHRGVPAIYGDLSDTEVLEELNLDQANLVISTATDPADSKVLLSELKTDNSKAKVVVRVTEEDDVSSLKKMGADYVILPESVSADFLVDQLKQHWPKIDFSQLD